MTDPDPNPNLEVLLKWDGVGLPPKRPVELEVQPTEIENTEDQDEAAHENEIPKSKKSSPPAGPGNVGDGASEAKT